MQPQFPVNPRQRPLHKSMFLPTSQQHLSKNVSVQYQYQDMIKRPPINPDNNSKLINYQTSQPNLQTHIPINNQLNNVGSNPMLSFNSTPRHTKQGPMTRANLYQQFGQNLPSNDQYLRQIQQKVDKLTSLVEGHQQILKKHRELNSKDESTIQAQVQAIQSRLKDTVIPNMINKRTTQIYEAISNFKVQISCLKQEVSEINSLRQDVPQINNKFKNQLLALASPANGSDKSASINNLYPAQRAERKQELAVELSANVDSLEFKIGQIQRGIQTRNDDLKAFILAQIQKSQSKNWYPGASTKIKPSTIRSTLPPILLQYRQLFVVKDYPTNQTREIFVQKDYPTSLTRIPSPKPKQPQQQTSITISSTTYYIDKQGYLLDNDSRYIVDIKGSQIRLQQKHLSLLKQNNVLS